MNNRISSYFQHPYPDEGGSKPAPSMGWDRVYTVDEAWRILCERAAKRIPFAAECEPHYHHKDAHNLAGYLEEYVEAHPDDTDDKDVCDPTYLIALLYNLMDDARAEAGAQ